MKPAPPSQRISKHERIYGWMVGLYPAPFREKFRQEMKQVFREQHREANERAGSLGVAMLWVHVLADFAWTCTKENFLALPSLPKRTWEHVLRRPTWVYPSLIATTWLLLTIIATFSMPQVFQSSVEIELRKESRDLASPARDPYFLQNEFAKIKSKAVLYQVISNLNLGAHYQTIYNLNVNLRPEETYVYLTSLMKIDQQRNTELIEISVYDQDKVMAKKIANETAEIYRKWKTKSAGDRLVAEMGIPPETLPASEQGNPQFLSDGQRETLISALAEASTLVRVINPAEVALRPSLPNRKLNIAIGIVISSGVGTICFFVLLFVKHRRTKRPPTLQYS